MTHEIIIAGFGGQGILAMGKILAKAALKEGKNVSWLPSYGPEMRGGTASCNIIISEEKIGAPVVSEATAALVLNKPSLEKFERSVIQGGALFVNGSLVGIKSSRNDLNKYYIPANEIANDIGNSNMVNMIMLGAYLEVSEVVKQDTIVDVINEIFGSRKPSIIEINKEALVRGMAWGKMKHFI